MPGKWLTPDTVSASRVCRRLSIPDDPQFLAVIIGTLLDMSYSFNWEQFGAVTPDDTASVFVDLVEQFRSEFPCMLGAVFPYATADPPAGTIACDGGSYLRSDYPDLYDALDAAFIVDATHFRSPDLRGRGVIGVGAGVGLTNRSVNDKAGEEAHTLSVSEMPSHTHTYREAAFLPLALAGTAANTFIGYNVVPTNSVGSDVAHNNMPPFIALKYCMIAR